METRKPPIPEDVLAWIRRHEAVPLDDEPTEADRVWRDAQSVEETES